MNVSISIGEIAGHSIFRDTEIRSDSEGNGKTNMGE